MGKRSIGEESKQTWSHIQLYSDANIELFIGVREYNLPKKLESQKSPLALHASLKLSKMTHTKNASSHRFLYFPSRQSHNDSACIRL